VLNVTWLRDANYAQTSGYKSDGKMSWATATNWVANLTVGGYGDWRLPTMVATPNASSSYAGGTDNGYNVRTKSGNPSQYAAGQTVYSEMASLWYDTLGNKAWYTTAGTGPQSGWGLANAGDFQGLQSGHYWSGLRSGVDSSGVEYAPDTYAWYLYTVDGFQSLTEFQTLSLYALPVLDGDVLATPIPAAAWLMLSGLGALGAAARRRKAS
jgi:hypothetical protein